MLEDGSARLGSKVLAIVTVDIMAWLLLRPWLEGLQSAGFEVHIACAKGKYYDQLAAAGFIMHPVSFHRTFNIFAHILPFFELIALLRSGKFQIVNTHSPVAAAVGRMAAVFASVDNIVYTVHGFYFHDRMPSFLRNQMVAIEWFLGRWTDAFMFVSDEDRIAAQRLGICGANARICTIYNGVDIDTFHPPPHSRAAVLRLQHGFADRPVVGVVGRIVKEKGYREFLDMAIALTHSGYDATYLVVGDSLPSDRDHFGPELRAQVAKANLAGRFVFTGMTDQVPDYLGLMDIFVLPSYREGFPRSILEAMAAGLPVVATDIRGCREAVVDGLTGYIVPPRDAKALRAAVESLLLNPERRAQMGNRARQIAVDRYDFRKVRKQFVAFIQTVFDGGPAFLVGAPITKLATMSVVMVTLLMVLVTMYVVPDMAESLLAGYYHGEWAFVFLGDALGCVALGFLLGWRWAAILYVGLAVLESLCVVAGRWDLKQVIWFSNLIPAIVIAGWLIPLVLGARNWRRPRRIPEPHLESGRLLKQASKQ